MNRRRLGPGLLLAGLVALGLAASPALRGAVPPPLILVSMDAFRWDYPALHPAETPHIRDLIAHGAAATDLIPAFPSNTFPNHYTIVTGLYPSHHGIVNNEFFDPTDGELFHYNRPENSNRSRWWGGEPIWVTAVRQGRAAATYFWPGSEAEIKGVRPTYWKPFDLTRTFAQRCDVLLEWLQLPADRRPAVIAFYLEETNTVGHKEGPDSPQLARTLQQMDNAIGVLESRLDQAGIAANLVLVSDHGMTAISTERVILLDEFIDPAAVQTDFQGPVVGLRPLDGNVDALVQRLAPLRHAKAYRTADVPSPWHITANVRNPAVWIAPEEGWEVYFRSKYETYRQNFNRGDHGFDPTLRSMHGILIAAGPSFRSGVTVGPVENIHIYNLLCAALGLKPAPNDGDDRLVQAMLRVAP